MLIGNKMYCSDTGGLGYSELNTFAKALSNAFDAPIIARCVLALSFLQVITFKHLAQEYDLISFLSSLWIKTSWYLQGLNILPSKFYPPMSKSRLPLMLILYYTTTGISSTVDKSYSQGEKWN